MIMFFFFFNDTATTEIYTLSLHDALPISLGGVRADGSAIDVETARSYEVGLKFASLDQTSALSIAYFDITKSDILAADPSDNRFVTDRKSTRLNSSHPSRSRMPSSA